MGDYYVKLNWSSCNFWESNDNDLVYVYVLVIYNNIESAFVL